MINLTIGISHKYLNHGIEKVPAYVNSSSIRLLLNYVFFFNLFCILLIKAYTIQMLKPIKREQEVVRMFLQCLFYNVFWLNPNFFNYVYSFFNETSPNSNVKLIIGPKNLYSRSFIKRYLVFQNKRLELALLVTPFKSIKSFSSNSVDKPEKFYEDSLIMKNLILKENENKSGIYRWINRSSGYSYVGQSTNLSGRFKNYFNKSYLSSKKNSTICRALLKYGYSNFNLEILEYCNISILQEREQYYLDKFNPIYNILKIAGSSRGFKHSKLTKIKISKSLKGVYVGEKSGMFGRVHSKETKELMSIKKAGDNNPLYGKTHSDKTKELLRLKKLGRVHSEATKKLISKARGNPVNIYEKDSEGKFVLVGAFVSTRKAAEFLGISKGSVTRYLQSGKLFNYRYKFMAG